MLLVPLLVAVAILVVAASSRTDVLKAEVDWLESLDAPVKPSRGGSEPPALRSLADAFPQLALWIPAHDAIYQRTNRAEGSAGPDIVVHAFSEAVPRRELRTPASRRPVPNH